MIDSNTITGGIGAALNKEFGDNYAIYSEKVLQGISLPCFIINQFDSDYQRQIAGGKRHERRFVITYLTADECLNPAEECNNIAERLYDCLDFIEVDGQPMHGADLKHEYDPEDSSLRFYVNFIFFAKTVKDERKMDGLKHNTGLKKG